MRKPDSRLIASVEKAGYWSSMNAKKYSTVVIILAGLIAATTIQAASVDVQTLTNATCKLAGPRSLTLLDRAIKTELKQTGVFDITPDADLTVSLEIVGYRPPPFCFAPDPLMPRKAFSSTGSISVMAYVTNRQNRQVASYLLTDRLYGEILPPDISGPLQRIAERVAKSMKAEFGSM